jgi:hypothetical protein
MYTLIHGNTQVEGNFNELQVLAKALKCVWAILDSRGIVMAAYRGVL